MIINPVDYKYNYVTSGVDSPNSGNLELMLGYGFLDLTDNNVLTNSNIAGMAGAGKMTDYSAGLSYYWNKYVALRLNYHHMQVKQWGQTTRRRSTRYSSACSICSKCVADYTRYHSGAGQRLSCSAPLSFSLIGVSHPSTRLHAKLSSPMEYALM